MMTSTLSTSMTSYAMRRSGPQLFLDPVCPWHLLLLAALKLEAWHTSLSTSFWSHFCLLTFHRLDIRFSAQGFLFRRATSCGCGTLLGLASSPAGGSSRMSRGWLGYSYAWPSSKTSDSVEARASKHNGLPMAKLQRHSAVLPIVICLLDADAVNDLVAEDDRLTTQDGLGHDGLGTKAIVWFGYRSHSDKTARQHACLSITPVKQERETQTEPVSSKELCPERMISPSSGLWTDSPFEA